MTTITDGLIGFYGHTYDDDDIQYQFKVIRKLENNRWAVQYYSFVDGAPTNVGIYAEAELLGPCVKLYADQDLWLHAYDERRKSWR